MRIYEIAKALGITSPEVRSLLASIGQPVRSASSKVEPIFARTFIEWRRQCQTPVVL